MPMCPQIPFRQGEVKGLDVRFFSAESAGIIIAPDMDEQSIKDILSARRRGLLPGLLRAALWLASRPYSLAVRLRRWMYRRGLRKRHQAGVPVICMGNLTTGGTGKTPMAAWAVNALKQAGRTPAVLTRGYKATGGKSDEAQLLAGLCDVPVIVNADRAAGAQQAVADGADVLVMDDGFGHLRLRRDLDIVLIDATNPFGYGHCLPRGLLREPTSALRHADAVVITHADAADEEALASLSRRIGQLAPSASLHVAAHRPVRIIDHGGADLPVEALAGRKVFAFCGIGNPEYFFAMLAGLYARCVGTWALQDHAAYTSEQIALLRKKTEHCQADLLITTQKDFVKLAGLELPRPVWQLVVDMRITQGADELLQKVLAAAKT